jgi:hypothetical protein
MCKILGIRVKQLYFKVSVVRKYVDMTAVIAVDAHVSYSTYLYGTNKRRRKRDLIRTILVCAAPMVFYSLLIIIAMILPFLKYYMIPLMISLGQLYLGDITFGLSEGDIKNIREDYNDLRKQLFNNK